VIYKNKPAITTVVLHHTAVSRARQPLQTTSVNTYHKNKDWGGGWRQPHPSELGFYGGYNFIVEPTGKRTQYRKIGEETIAQIGNNCDTPSRCGMISYCMAGDFRVEKPTSHQVADFVDFVTEVRSKYPDAVIKQHKDVASGRTCAELSADEISSWFTDTDDKDKIIERLKKQNSQLISMVTLLISLLKKK